MTLNIEGVTLLNDPISLNEFKGQYILLDFWEVWCGPCIMAFPNILVKRQTIHFLYAEVMKQARKVAFGEVKKPD